MAKKRKHRTTKNTFPKPRVTRLAEISGDINGPFTIVTNLSIERFESLYKEWYDSPFTKIWTPENLVWFIKSQLPECICVTKEQYTKQTKGKVTNASKEEWEAENN